MAGSSASSGVASGSNVSSSSLINSIPDQNGFQSLQKNNNKNGSKISTGRASRVNIFEMMRRGISVIFFFLIFVELII